MLPNTQPPPRKFAIPPPPPPPTILPLPYILPKPQPYVAPPPRIAPVPTSRHPGSAMGSGYNPYMQNMGTMGAGGYSGQPMSAVGSMAPSQGQGQMGSMASGEGYKSYDAGKLKGGRLGHYGYLEGRELSGPPPGYLPAGIKPTQSHSGSGSAPSQHPGLAPSQYAPSQYAQQMYQQGPAQTYLPQSPGSMMRSQAHGGSQIDGRLGKAHRRMREGNV